MGISMHSDQLPCFLGTSAAPDLLIVIDKAINFGSLALQQPEISRAWNLQQSSVHE